MSIKNLKKKLMKNPKFKKEYELLGKAPKDHHSEEFLEFLRDNNEVVFENDQWLIIENCKYHTKEKPWLTAFWKDYNSFGSKEWYDDIDILWYQYGDWAWIKKSTSDQTVKRFHIHLTKN